MEGVRWLGREEALQEVEKREREGDKETEAGEDLGGG